MIRIINKYHIILYLICNNNYAFVFIMKDITLYVFYEFDYIIEYYQKIYINVITMLQHNGKMYIL